MTKIAFAVIVTLGLTTAHAADPALLGTKLTANGANPAASADGVIPAYTGGITSPPMGYRRGQDHIDPFAADTPLYTVTAQNKAQYAARLSAGQNAMFARHPETYRIDVYPTRRACGLPQAVYDETKKNVTRAKLTQDGNKVVGARIGVPSPIPQNALEVYWNHNFHWQGHRYHAVTSGANVYPTGSRTNIIREDWRYNFYADPQGPNAKHENDQFHWMGVWKAPARFNGSGFSMFNTIDQVDEPRNGVMFNPNTRKIMRATPSAVTYDGPMSTADGMRKNHNMFVFSGSPDRYDWKLLGKKRMIVPYNAYKASATTTPRDGFLTPYHLNPDFLRYEEHRVWVLEATLKPGYNMEQARRIFYADEDSWIFLMSDIFDENNELASVHHAFVKNYYEAPACVLEFDVIYDVASGRYNVDHIKLDHGPADLDYDIKPSDFGSSALKRKVGR
ncbi:MAG: DUF1329 domain-containing protein [Alphaproteobacteria bacterium]|nr:DUF1329 domain-containing protein [Alphaproteobacteria bacterium]